MEMMVAYTKLTALHKCGMDNLLVEKHTLRLTISKIRQTNPGTSGEASAITREIVGSAGNIIAGGRTDSWNSKTWIQPTHLVDKKQEKIGYGLEFAGEEHGRNDLVCLDDINADGDFDCQGTSESSHFDIEQPNRTIEFWYWAEDDLPDEANVSKVMFDGAKSKRRTRHIHLQFQKYMQVAGEMVLIMKNGLTHTTTLEEWHHVAFVTDGAGIASHSTWFNNLVTMTA